MWYCSEFETAYQGGRENFVYGDEVVAYTHEFTQAFSNEEMGELINLVKRLSTKGRLSKEMYFFRPSCDYIVRLQRHGQVWVWEVSFGNHTDWTD